MIIKKTALLVFLAFNAISASANPLTKLSDPNFQPADSDYERLSNLKEYIDANTQLYKSLDVLRQAMEPSVVSKSNQPSSGGDSSAPSDFVRGSAASDVFSPKKKEEPKQQVAYISSISGMGSTLTAEIVWGDRVLSVKRNDSLIGGDWLVVSISQDDVVISNSSKSKTLRISSMPVDITDVFK